MWKFIIILVAIFAIFYLGGLILIDNSIVANGRIPRFPEAVGLQRFAFWMRDVAIAIATRAYLLAKPLLDQIVSFLSPVADQATNPSF